MWSLKLLDEPLYRRLHVYDHVYDVVLAMLIPYMGFLDVATA